MSQTYMQADMTPYTETHQSLKVFTGLVLLALALIAIPFLGITSPPLADYPNHMARFHILQNLETSTELQNFYALRGGFYPYMSIAVFMKIFAPVFGVEGAGRAFAVIAIFMPVLGTLTLSRAINGRVSLLALAMVPIALSAIAGWGFLNFLFSVGIVMMIFAGWIKTAQWPAARRIMLFAALTLAATCMHLISAAFLGLLIGFWELFAVLKNRKITRADILNFAAIALIFIPAGLLILTQLGGEFGTSETVYGSIGNKINVAQSPLSMFGGRGEIFIAQGIIIGLIILRSMKIIEIEGRLFFVGIAFLILGLLVPFQLFGVAYIGIRFPLIALAIIIAGIRNIDIAKARFAAIGLALFIAAKLWIVHSIFAFADTQTAQLRAAMQMLPAGAKVLPVMNSSAVAKTPLEERHYFHQPAYIVIDRDGLFPYFFSMFNVAVKAEHSSYTHIWGQPIELSAFDTQDQTNFADNWRQDFDYVIVMDNENAALTTPGLTPVAKGDGFSIYGVNP